MRLKNISYILERARKPKSKHLSKKSGFRIWLLKCISLLLGIVAVIVALCILISGGCKKKEKEEALSESQQTMAPVEEPLYAPSFTAETIRSEQEVESEYFVMLEAESGKILAEKNGEAQMAPASMTKVLTLLVAVEEIADKSGTFTITEEITDYCYFNECSVVGYEVGEKVSVMELFYGCILSSGADASLALAELACGSHEAFVEKINQKIKELGREETAHFTNCVGIYDEEHYCSVLDMAVFMKAALENPFCRSVLSTKKLNTTPTLEHPEGQVISNWFLRRIEDRDIMDVDVISAKTGFVAMAGSCAVSYGENSRGEGYICVSGKGTSSWGAIADHVAMYRKYAAIEAPQEETEDLENE